LLSGVEELKNVSQLLVIVEEAEPELEADAELEAELTGAELGVGVEVGLPLEHAVIAAAITRAGTEAR
jgi:hypothetical protein